MLNHKGSLLVNRQWILGLLAAMGCAAACSSNAEVAGSGGGSGAGGQSSSGASSNNGGDGGDMFGGGFGASAASSSADGGGGRRGNTCAAETAEVRPIELDLALLVDTSYSMDFELRWQYVKGALLSFVSQPAQSQLGLSMQFFPLRAQCDVSAYAEPALPMATLADSRTEVEAEVNARRMSGGTPIVQVLQGMGEYATAWAKDHPDRKTVVVLATDGVPDATCAAGTADPPNDLDNAAKMAKSLLDGTPSIPVFVIGVGDELESLNAIAEAGGTERAVLISDGASAQKEFLDALQGIRKKSLACDYLVPENNSKIDFDTVNVRYTEGRASPSTFFYVTDESGCDLKPDEGWYYDDPASPTKVVLCQSTCTRVVNAEDARIDIEYGCERVVAR